MVGTKRLTGFKMKLNKLVNGIRWHNACEITRLICPGRDVCRVLPYWWNGEWAVELHVHCWRSTRLHGSCAICMRPGSVHKNGWYLGISVQSSFSLIEKNITLQAIYHIKIFIFFNFKFMYRSLFTCKIAGGSAGGLINFGTLQMHKLVIACICGAYICQYDLFAQNKIFSRA